MQLAFKELEVILQTHFGVNEEGEAAFRGRVQHLQRAGIPAGVNTGKGRPAVYRWPQLIELLVVLDLIDIGLSPEAARVIVSDFRESLLDAAASFGDGCDEETFLQWISNEQCPIEESRIIITSWGALHALSGGQEIIFECLNGAQFASSIADEESYRPASCMVNLSKKLLATLNYLRVKAICELGEAQGPKIVVEDFRSWRRGQEGVIG